MKPHTNKVIVGLRSNALVGDIHKKRPMLPSPTTSSTSSGAHTGRASCYSIISKTDKHDAVRASKAHLSKVAKSNPTPPGYFIITPSETSYLVRYLLSCGHKALAVNSAGGIIGVKPSRKTVVGKDKVLSTKGKTNRSLTPPVLKAQPSVEARKVHAPSTESEDRNSFPSVLKSQIITEEIIHGKITELVTLSSIVPSDKDDIEESDIRVNRMKILSTEIDEAMSREPLSTFTKEATSISRPTNCGGRGRGKPTRCVNTHQTHKVEDTTWLEDQFGVLTPCKLDTGEMVKPTVVPHKIEEVDNSVSTKSVAGDKPDFPNPPTNSSSVAPEIPEPRNSLPLDPPNNNDPAAGPVVPPLAGPVDPISDPTGSSPLTDEVISSYLSALNSKCMNYEDWLRMEYNEARRTICVVLMVLISIVFIPATLLPTILCFIFSEHLTLYGEIGMPLIAVLTALVYATCLFLVALTTRTHKPGEEKPKTLFLVTWYYGLCNCWAGIKRCQCAACTIQQCALNSSRTFYSWNIRRDVYSACCPPYLSKKLDTNFYNNLTYKVKQYCTDNLNPVPSPAIMLVLTGECLVIITRLMSRRNSTYTPALASLNAQYNVDLRDFVGK